MIPGVVLSGLGAVLLLAQLELYDMWEFWLPVRRYWPIVLILAGLALLIGGRLKRPLA